MNRRPLRVGVFPYGGSENPYQDSFCERLEEQGVLVERVRRSGRLDGLRQVLDLDVDIIQADWLEGVYRGRSVASSLAKFVVLERDLRRLSAPLVWTIHNLEPHEPAAFPLLDRVAEGQLARKASAFLHFSSGAHISWSERHPCAASKPWCRVVERVDGAGYANTISRTEARLALSLPLDSHVALCFGNIRPYKGFLKLAQTFLSSAGEGSVLLIAGSPHDPQEAKALDDLANRSAGRIRTVLRWVAEDEVQVFMNAADVGIAPFVQVNNSGTVALMVAFDLSMILPDLESLRSGPAAGTASFYSPHDVSQAILLFEGMRHCPARRVGGPRASQTNTSDAASIVLLYNELLRR